MDSRLRNAQFHINKPTTHPFTWKRWDEKRRWGRMGWGVDDVDAEIPIGCHYEWHFERFVVDDKGWKRGGDKMRDSIEDNIGPDLVTINFSSNWRNRVNIIGTSLSPIKQKWRLKIGISGREQWRLVRRILISSRGYQGNIESLNSATECDLNLVSYSFDYMSGYLSISRSKLIYHVSSLSGCCIFYEVYIFFEKVKVVSQSLLLQ